jgi:hypothetical protein
MRQKKHAEETVLLSKFCKTKKERKLEGKFPCPDPVRCPIEAALVGAEFKKTEKN